MHSWTNLLHNSQRWCALIGVPLTMLVNKSLNVLVYDSEKNKAKRGWTTDFRSSNLFHCEPCGHVFMYRSHASHSQTNNCSLGMKQLPYNSSAKESFIHSTFNSAAIQSTYAPNGRGGGVMPITNSLPRIPDCSLSLPSLLVWLINWAVASFVSAVWHKGW